jgi:bifunctional N-acetylglucosamine-1-phosphate-uridyltransferase/glucosamine-1-phosphate-acetyltransferase GlmU-like protein
MVGVAPTAPSVVVLAAGLGSRFGGLKQLVAVGADGAAIMDILVRRAAAAGFGDAVIVVAPGTEEAVRAHLDAMPAAPVPVGLAVQQPAPSPRSSPTSRPLGTAAAVLAARGAVTGSFAVVNGDDLYPADGFEMLARHLRDAPPTEHAMVAFRAGRTLTGDRPVSRALVETDAAGALRAIREGTVVPTPDGLRFEAGAETFALPAEQPVSMNMWAFREPIFGALQRAVAAFVAAGCDGEVFLPDVVAAMVEAGATVRVLVSDHSCVGVTHNEDLGAVKAALAVTARA